MMKNRYQLISLIGALLLFLPSVGYSTGLYKANGPYASLGVTQSSLAPLPTAEIEWYSANWSFSARLGGMDNCELFEVGTALNIVANSWLTPYLVGRIGKFRWGNLEETQGSIGLGLKIFEFFGDVGFKSSDAISYAKPKELVLNIGWTLSLQD